MLYGAAEFSRDTDLALLASPENIARLRKVLKELRAESIAVPPFEVKYLKCGHAVHFRCWHPDALRLRIDIMARMRGVDAFGKLWTRRTSIELPDGTKFHVMSLFDLVQAKKTQRDKDWPMIRRLVEAHYYEHRRVATRWHVDFWLREMRTAELLIEVVQQNTKQAESLERTRPLLKIAQHGSVEEVTLALAQEEQRERDEDRKYWLPLKLELEALRRNRMKT